MPKRQRGQPDNPWNALKNATISIDVTKVARALFKSKIRALGFKTIAEFIEKFSRGQIEIRIRLPEEVTIAGLMVAELDRRQWEPEKMAIELDLTLERIDALLNYDRATHEELIALRTILTKEDGSEWEPEDLIEINGSKKEKGKNGQHQRVQ